MKYITFTNYVYKYMYVKPSISTMLCIASNVSFLSISQSNNKPGQCEDDDDSSNVFQFPFFFADYEGTGFLAFQYAVDLAVIKHFNSSAAVDLFDLFLKKMPYPPYTKDNLTTILQMYLPFFLILGFILSALQTTKAIVYEKEKKLKV